MKKVYISKEKIKEFRKISQEANALALPIYILRRG